jgi:hypothetical protein
MASLPRKESSSCPLNLISQRENEDSWSYVMRWSFMEHAKWSKLILQ